MSMRPVPTPGIPTSTVSVARAAFPAGTLAMRLRDELGVVYQNADFVELFARRGAPAASPGVLALVCVLQYAERLTDRQTADAVRGRIDWKYALGMELTDPGFEFSALAGFRARLVEHGMEHQPGGYAHYALPLPGRGHPVVVQKAFMGSDQRFCGSVRRLAGTR